MAAALRVRCGQGRRLVVVVRTVRPSICPRLGALGPERFVRALCAAATSQDAAGNVCDWSDEEGSGSEVERVGSQVSVRR